MEVKTERNGESKETNYLIIEVGNERYRITEDKVDGIILNKTSDGQSDTIMIYPSCSNEIRIF